MTDEHHDYRGYAGQVAGGVLRPGDEVVVLPSGRTTRIARDRHASTGQLDEAFPPMSVTLRLDDDLDISRGDMICRPHNQPTVGPELDAMVCWMAERPLRAGGALRAQAHHPHGARHGRRRALPPRRQHAAPRRGRRRARRSTRSAACSLRTDARRCSSTSTARNRATGSFILIDEATNDTVGAGMVFDIWRLAPGPVDRRPSEH